MTRSFGWVIVVLAAVGLSIAVADAANARHRRGGSDGGYGSAGGGGSYGGSGSYGGNGSAGGNGSWGGSGSEGGRGSFGGLFSRQRRNGSDGGYGSNGGNGSSGGNGSHGGSYNGGQGHAVEYQEEHVPSQPPTAPEVQDEDSASISPLQSRFHQLVRR
jgi:hypothetical protein